MRTQLQKGFFCGRYTAEKGKLYVNASVSSRKAKINRECKQNKTKQEKKYTVEQENVQ